MLSTVWWAGLASHHAMAWDQFLVRKEDRLYNRKHVGQQARVLVHHHQGLSLSLPGNYPLTVKARALRQEQLGADPAIVILTVISCSSSGGRQTRAQV